MILLGPIDPQPPKGIKYVIGGESWLPPEDRTPRRLICEEWGNLGLLVLDPAIEPNTVGLRVRTSEILAPEGANWFHEVDGVYYWTKETCWELMGELRESASESAK